MRPRKKNVGANPCIRPRTKKAWKAKPIFAAMLTGIFAMGMVASNNVVATKKEMESVTQQIKIAFDQAKTKGLRGNFTSSEMAFEDLEKNIQELKNILGPLSLISNTNGEMPVRDLLLLAENITELGKNSAEMGNELKTLPSLFLTNEHKKALETIESAEKKSHEFLALITDAKKNISGLKKNTIIGDSITKKINEMEKIFPEIEKNTEKIISIFPAVFAILGEENTHTTALFYQNTGEIRASGGFIGSMSYMFGEAGKISGEFNDIYALSWKDESQLPPPAGFERLTTKLNVQDANFEPHFPDSAKNLRMMLSHTNSPVPETVVTINDALFFEILDVTGDITLHELDATLNASNADMLLSFFVEAKASGKSTPKEIMRDMIPILFERIQRIPPQKMLEITQEAIEKKWILAHSTNPEIQTAIETLGMDGKIKNEIAADSLAVFSANVGGNKSDRFIEETLHISSAVSAENIVINTLKIEHEHTWGGKEDARVERLLNRYGSYLIPANILREILGAGDNHSFMQVFVPQNSALLAVNGIPPEDITIEEKNGKTVFLFRFPAVAAGKSETVELQYRLPSLPHDKGGPKGINSENNFDLFFQSQSGRGKVRVIREIATEAGVEIKGQKFLMHETESDALFYAEVVKK